MSSEGILPCDLAELVGGELASGERIAWVGQPIPSRFARSSIAIVLFAIPWTAFSVFWVATAAAGKGSMPSGNLFRFFPLFGVPFVLIGLGMLSSPLWMVRKARRTAYVITDRRALILDGGGWGGTKIRSFEPERLRDLTRVQSKDGAGDLIFEREWRETGRRGRQSTDIGFLAVPNVKEVEERVRALAATAGA